MLTIPYFVFFSYASVFAAAVWDHLFSKDPFCAEAGFTLRSKLLKYGGSKDPATMIRDVLHGEITITPLMKSLGVKVDN